MGCTDLPQFALCLSRSPARKMVDKHKKDMLEAEMQNQLL